MRDCLSRLAGVFWALAIPAAIMPAPSWASRIKHSRAVFAGLDKITGRTIKFEAAAGETVQFGTLQITERACFTRPATEAPQTVTFVEVDEVDAGKQYKRIFSGWMFAASPGLHGIEHPIYDVWLTDCGGEDTLEAGLEPPQNATPAESKRASQETAPVPPAKALKRQRRTLPSEIPAPPADDQMDAAPGKSPGIEEQSSAGAPPLGQPIEVGPPPGFIPVPQDDRMPQNGRMAPVQRFYPIEPDTTAGDSGADGF